jgi:IS605 OrfB family transposase
MPVWRNTMPSPADDKLISMKQCLQVRLLPTPTQAQALLGTLHACNAAASWLSAQMHQHRIWRKFDVQKRWYDELKQRFRLSAQPAIRVISKTADAYTALHAKPRRGNDGRKSSHRQRNSNANPITFSAVSGQPFDGRCLSWQLGQTGREGTVSIWTTFGRMKNVRVLGSPVHMALLRGQAIGETDLIYRDGGFFLLATVETPAQPVIPPENGFLGVDLGIVNIATTSDAVRVSGAKLIRYRKRQLRIRRRLQSKRTSSARRLLVKRCRKERRFSADVNHQISKSIVAEAQRTGRGVAIEELGGIRARVRLRKPQRATLHSWAFAQLGRFLAYKAQRAGIPFVRVDPRYTSQTCHQCGHTEKKNRKSQEKFLCARCGFVGHADHNAACNIAVRGLACWGEAMRPHAAPTLAASWGGSSNPNGKP